MDAITLICLALLVLLLHLIRSRLAKRRLPVPSPPLFPFVRHLPILAWYGTFGTMAAALQKKYGDVFQLDFGLGSGPVVVLCNPAHFAEIKHVRERGMKLMYKNNKLDPFYTIMRGDAFFNLANEEWQRRRRIVLPVFTTSWIDGLLPAMLQKAYDVLVRGWLKKFNNQETSEPFLVAAELQHALFEIQVGTAFGIHQPQDAQLYQWISTVIQACYLEACGVPTWWTRRGGKLKNMMNKLEDVLMEVVRAAYELPLEELDCRRAIVPQLVAAYKRDQDGSLVDLTTVIGELCSLLTASFETTSMAVASALRLLDQHQAVQDRVLEELRETLPASIFGVQHGTENPFESVDQDMLTAKSLPYLTAVMNETLRLHPVAATLDRTLAKDLYLEGVGTIPKDTKVLMGASLAMTSPEIWGENANEFVPERWLDSEVTKEQKAFSLQFGYGRRNCVGKNLGAAGVRVALIAILSNFVVKVVAPNTVKTVEGLAAGPKAMKVTLQRR
eukprot:TRINITY_DN113373_c0_g1_i1.p1 TRINITY_DN113373_c0_g1~~TRINITY_DN113373_c0_g1_i1.p1  ORF type:complete len:501 (-),score=43.32 TRINITY_DN113373_c0_g1_i1:66-1568(-)